MIKLKDMIKEQARIIMTEKPSNSQKMKNFINKFDKTTDGRAVKLVSNNNIWMRKDIVDNFEKHLNALMKSSGQQMNVSGISIKKLDDKNLLFNKEKTNHEQLLQLIRVTNHLLK